MTAICVMGVAALVSLPVVVCGVVWLVLRYAERTYVPGAQPLSVIRSEQEHAHATEADKLELKKAAVEQAKATIRERAFGS